MESFFYDLLLIMGDSSTSPAKRPPDDTVDFGASPEKESDLMFVWPVTVRVHATGDLVQLVELLFVPDTKKSKTLCTAVLRYDASVHARARTPSCREFKILNAQAMFYAYGNDKKENGPIWRGLVRIHSWTIYASI